MKKVLMALLMILLIGTGCGSEITTNAESAQYDLYNDTSDFEVEELSKESNELLNKDVAKDKVYVYLNNDNYQILFNYRSENSIIYNGEASDYNNYYFETSSENNTNSFYDIISYKKEEDYEEYLKSDIKFYLDGQEIVTTKEVVNFELEDNLA